MLYDNDVTQLLALWKERMSFQTTTQEYKDALRDCIYDVKLMEDKNKQYLKLAQLMLGSDESTSIPINTPPLSTIINNEAASYLAQ